jgi:hypothetical protein
MFSSRPVLSTVFFLQGQNDAAEGSKQPGTKPRDKNYVNSEDELLCSAWLNVSKDAAVGTSQSSGAYWGWVAGYFNEFRRTSIQRSSNSCQKRWGEIQKETYKFSCCYAEIGRRNQSGKSEDDKVSDSDFPCYGFLISIHVVHNVDVKLDLV